MSSRLSDFSDDVAAFAATFGADFQTALPFQGNSLGDHLRRVALPARKMASRKAPFASVDHQLSVGALAFLKRARTLGRPNHKDMAMKYRLPMEWLQLVKCASSRLGARADRCEVTMRGEIAIDLV